MKGKTKRESKELLKEGEWKRMIDRKKKQRIRRIRMGEMERDKNVIERQK